MNRREFLKRLALVGLVLPSTKTIIDMGANLWKQPQEGRFTPEVIGNVSSVDAHYRLDGNTITLNMRPIMYRGAKVTLGDLKHGKIVELVYDGSHFNLQGSNAL
jgi:hypothetical protein